MALDILQERTARRDHSCYWECGDPIKAGERYVRSALPPGGELGYLKWMHAALHGPSRLDCPRNRQGAAP